MKETSKVCSKCGKQKTLNCFHKDKSTKDKLAFYCKLCRKGKSVDYYIKNKEKIKKASVEWKTKNKAKKIALDKRCYEMNREKRIIAAKEWKINNPLKVQLSRNKSNKKARSTPIGRLNNNISRGINSSLKSKTKGNRHWEKLVNFTVVQLRTHLEKLFTPEMTWENYGLYWHLDHVVPITVFNFDKPEHIDFRRCWSIKNLQPLEKLKNLSKGAKIDRPFQPSLPLAIEG